MILNEIMTEMKTQLQNQIASWQSDESELFEVAVAGEPEPMSNYFVTIQESGQIYDQNSQQTSADIGFELIWGIPAVEQDRFVWHSSLDENGIQRAIWNLRINNRLPRIEGESMVMYSQQPRPGSKEMENVCMRNVELRWEFNFADARKYPISDVPINLPVLPPDLSDIYGIKFFEAENILYLTEGNPSSAAEADIHSYDFSMTPPERREQEISAGISADDFHRALEGEGDFLFSISDESTRGSWALHRINRKLNVQTHRRDLGDGDFTALYVFGDNKEFVGVAEHYGSGTRWHTFMAADLEPVDDDSDDVAGFGFSSGGIDLGHFGYDIVNCTAICQDFQNGNQRRLDLDVYLGGFRIQWRDMTKRGNNLLVSGVESTENGNVGILKEFPIPSEVLGSII